MDSGHYFSYIKEYNEDNDRWLEFNDSEVKEFSEGISLFLYAILKMLLELFLGLIPQECFGGFTKGAPVNTMTTELPNPKR